MKFVFIRSLCIFPLVLLLTGCCRILWEKDTAPYAVITQVQITYENGPLQTQHQFFREDSIRHILDYLRYIDPYGHPREDPEASTGRNYHILVIYSDGSFHTYHQRADQYMRIDDGEWKRIDPQKALYLSGLLGMMPSETPEDAPIQ